MRTNNVEVTPREWAQMNQEKEMYDKQATHMQVMKQLDVQLATLESKWSSWLKLPVKLVLLPVLLVIGIAMVVYAIRGKDVPENLLTLFR